MKKPIYLLGDIHGSYNVIVQWITRSNIENAFIIQVGDFGVGFRNPSHEDVLLDQLNQILNSRNIQLYAMRGNHDDPSCFGPIKEFEKSNLHFVEDYTILELEGIRILCVGGAISIDRTYRKKDIPPSWFPDEVFVLNEEKLLGMKNIDVVITHSAPSFCHPVGWNQLVHDWADVDPGLHSELPKERKDLDRMHEILVKENKITNWIYGHYHFSHTEKHGEINFTLLGIGEFKELD